jgi:hypothetical protein
MAESIWSDGGSNQNQALDRRRAASRRLGPAQGQRTRREEHAPSHRPQMSSDRAIPWSGCSPALPASASPGTGDHKSLDARRRTDYHRTVSASFPACLTLGGHPIICVDLRLSVAQLTYFFLLCHVRKPTIVFASSILPPSIIFPSSLRSNQRVSMRSSSIGVASPALRSSAR